MKTLKTLTTVILIAVLVNTASAFNFPAISATANSENELYTAIEQLIDYPAKGIDFAKSGYVTTTFKVDNNGWIEVKKVKGEKVLSNHVKKQLNRISVENPDLFGKYYTIKIYFDFQEQ
ncbi:MAG: hypothetical protein C0599_09245 [Salinivirgaceae bacterium]|nr:MAG: hypothetical protein C0599_09245 [Salinivirgaceae bacterium]